MADDDRFSIGSEGAARLSRERRRPGRSKHADPALLPLLRGESTPALEWGDDGENALDPATGIAVSALISCVIWAMLALVF